jgi:hypothetical protein
MIIVGLVSSLDSLQAKDSPVLSYCLLSRWWDIGAVCFPCQGKSHHGLAPWQHRSTRPAAPACPGWCGAALATSQHSRRAPPSMGWNRRNLRSCRTKPSIEVVGEILWSCGSTSYVRGVPIDDILPFVEEWVGPSLLVVSVGPLWMLSVISLHYFGDLGAKMITPSLSPHYHGVWQLSRFSVIIINTISLIILIKKILWWWWIFIICNLVCWFFPSFCADCCNELLSSKAIVFNLSSWKILWFSTTRLSQILP